MNKERKLLLGAAAVIMLLTVFGCWIAYENDFFLPQAHIAMGYMEWDGRRYYPQDGKYCYEIGDKIAKDRGYYIFCLAGDTKKEYKVTAQGTGWGAGQFSLEHTLFTRNDYIIPLTGKASGIVVASHNSRFGKYVSSSQAENVLSMIQKLDDEDKSGIKINASENNTSAVWICYDNCPASGVLSGRMGRIDGQLYFMTENAVYTISDKDVIEEWNHILE